MHLRSAVRSLLLALTFAATAWGQAPQSLVTVRGHQFYKDAKPYYFVGTNFWYAPILGSEGQGGNRDRLVRELDSLKAIGVDNLRILVGPDEAGCKAYSVRPYLQPLTGELNDTLLDGLDYVLMQMEKRDMTAVLFLTNSWDWSGGYTHYLQRVGYDDAPNAAEDYDAYTQHAAHFLREPQAQQLYFDFVRQVVGRTNRYTQRPYAESPAIMAWQVCNEPRPFASDVKEAFLVWLTRSAQLIKELDPHHLVSTGTEGLYGCATDEDLLEQVSAIDAVDYLTIHIWPVNWRWSSAGSLYTALPNVFLKTQEYVDLHLRMAEKLRKPLVIEEFGYPRNQNFRLDGTPTSYRDAFYNFVFNLVKESKERRGALAGCNFWGWGGLGRSTHRQWQPGDDYLCDPAHEPQGWYSVYHTDSTTVRLIEQYAGQLAD